MILLGVFLSLGISLQSFAGSPLQDVKYSFDVQKLDAAKDPFHFLRTYVDYYYLLAKTNRTALPSLDMNWNTTAWCVGDAHPENFGFLIQNDGSSVFTMNDVDDSGPCPAVLDLFRLMVSSRLYDKNTKLDHLTEAYLAGVQGKSIQMPSRLQTMLTESQKKGTHPSDNKVRNNTLVRDKNMFEVTADERIKVTQSLRYIYSFSSPDTQVVDMVSTSKVGGGSGGLLRYEVLLDDKGMQTHLELKEQLTPAIYPVATAIIPEALERVMTTLKNNQGGHFSFYYNVIQINNKSMMVRPKYEGNLGVHVEGQDIETTSENRDIVYYEAYTLGAIHSRSIKDIPTWANSLQAVPQKILEDDVQAITTQFETKFGQLNPSCAEINSKLHRAVDKP